MAGVIAAGAHFLLQRGGSPAGHGSSCYGPDHVRLGVSSPSVAFSFPRSGVSSASSPDPLGRHLLNPQPAVFSVHCRSSSSPGRGIYSMPAMSSTHNGLRPDRRAGVISKVCAWCVRDGHQAAPVGPVSHGICREHSALLLAEAGIRIFRSGEVSRPVAAGKGAQ